MAPLRIVKFIISTRHLRNLSRAKEAQSDTIMAAFDDAELARGTSVAPPSRRFLIKARARLDVVRMLMRRFALQVRARDIRTSPQWYSMADSSLASGLESLNIIEIWSTATIPHTELLRVRFWQWVSWD